MLTLLHSLLILTSLVTTASEERHVDAVEVYSCDFSQDVNYDRWPDDWQRLRGPEWPFYVDIALEEDPQAVAGRCLTIHSNGGSASVSSPAISVSGMFSYVVEAKDSNTAVLRCESISVTRAARSSNPTPASGSRTHATGSKFTSTL